MIWYVCWQTYDVRVQQYNTGGNIYANEVKQASKMGGEHKEDNRD